MKRWWLVLALLLSVGVNLGILATLAVSRQRAEPPGPPSESERGVRGPELEGRISERVHHLARELGLEGEKRERFVELQRSFIENAIRARMKVWRLQGELREQLGAREPDRAQIDQLVQELGQAHTQLETVLVENIFATRELLDPEQQKRYLHLLARWRRTHGEREGPLDWERRFGPPDGRGPGRRPRGFLDRRLDRRPGEPPKDERPPETERPPPG